MDFQKVLDIVGDSGAGAYYLLEMFLLKLLSKHLETQGKVLQPQVRLLAGGRAFLREVDAVAPGGIDDLPGPVAVDIKLGGFIRSNSYKMQTVERLDSLAVLGEFKTMLLIVGGELREKDRQFFQENSPLRSGAPLVVWDATQVNELINKHAEFAESIASNLNSMRLDAIVERSSSVKTDAWKDVRAKHIQELHAAYSDNELALFLGAGASVDAGVPSWDTLLNAMLGKLVRRHDSGVISDEETLEIVARFRAIDNPSPLMAGRYLRRGLDEGFATNITAFLYENVARDANEKMISGTPVAPTLAGLARLCVPRRSGPGVCAVVTYNFDDLLEKQLDLNNVTHRPIFKEGDLATRDELAVYHVHGFLPQDRKKYSLAGDGVEGLVFSEEGYHRLFGDPYSWTNLIQLSLLRDATCLMIGLSLSDPNLRRLLEVSAKRNERFYHYAILRRMNVDAFVRDKAGNIVMKARSSAVERFLTVHHQIQEDLFAELGVKIIWIENFDEIPAIITAISTPTA